MADDVTLPGTGAIIAADEVGGKKYQVMKLAVGADGTAVYLAVGAGDVDEGTVRFTLAADDPAVAALVGMASAVATEVTAERAADALEAIEADTSTSAVAQVSYVDAATITPGTPVTAGQGVAIRCTAEGDVALKLSSGATLIVAAKVGQSWIDNIAVTDVVAGSTTGTHVVSVLYTA